MGTFRFLRQLVNYDPRVIAATIDVPDTYLDFFGADSPVECHRDLGPPRCRWRGGSVSEMELPAMAEAADWPADDARDALGNPACAERRRRLCASDTAGVADASLAHRDRGRYGYGHDVRPAAIE